MIMFGIVYQYKKVEILFRAWNTLQKIKEHVRVVKMDKKRLKVALGVLDAVKSKLPEIKELMIL